MGRIRRQSLLWWRREELAKFDQCGEVKEAVREAGLQVELHHASCISIEDVAIEDAYHLGLSPSGSGICIPNGAVLQLDKQRSVPADHVIWCSGATQPPSSSVHTSIPREPGATAAAVSNNVGEECTLDPGRPARGAWLWSMQQDTRLASRTTRSAKEAQLRALGSDVAKEVLHDLSSSTTAARGGLSGAPGAAPKVISGKPAWRSRL